MFEGITRSLSDAMKKFRGRRLTAENIRDGLEEVKKAFLEADVNYDVVNQFIANVEASAIGQDVLKKVDPSEQIVRIVYDELLKLMGSPSKEIPFAKGRPTILMMVGLQGSGKTTSTGKLALKLKKMNRKPLLVGADLQRPAAVEQIRVLGEQLGVPVFSQPTNPLDVCKQGIKQAQLQGYDTVILDTAGRLHVDKELLDELKQIDRQVHPDQIFLVLDAMTGQDAVQSAKIFNETLSLDGVILTKLDGDARGGAAISLRYITQVPIKYIGIGEKLDALEDFYPDRMVSRIMGQGDLMGVVEKIQSIQAKLGEEERKKQEEKIAKGDLNLADFRLQLSSVMETGMKSIFEAMPGMSEMIPPGEDPDRAIPKFVGMIDSMTPYERHNPEIIDLERRRRIADGSGCKPQEVNLLLKQFDTARAFAKKMANASFYQRMKMIMGMGQQGAFLPGDKGLEQMSKGNTGHRKSPKERAADKKKKKKRR